MIKCVMLANKRVSIYSAFGHKGRGSAAAAWDFILSSWKQGATAADECRDGHSVTTY